MKILYFIIILFCANTYSQQTICIGAKKSYSVDTNENNGDGTTGSAYTWNINNIDFKGQISNTTTSGNQVSIDWGTTPAGNYTLNIAESDANSCTTIQSLIIYIINTPTVSIEDVYICVNNTIWVSNPIFDTNLDSNLYTFKWYYNNSLLPITTSSITPDQIGKYKVIATNNTTGCILEETASTILSPPIIAQAITLDDFNDSNQFTIEATGGVPPYQYSIDGSFPQYSNLFTVNNSGKYLIKITDATGCNFTEVCACKFIYDKFFTPNADGFNDSWNIEIPRNLNNTTLTIFDRYGKLIKRVNPINEFWDGTYNNKKLMASDYWFTVDYENCNGERKEFKSHFTLKR